MRNRAVWTRTYSTAKGHLPPPKVFAALIYTSVAQLRVQQHLALKSEVSDLYGRCSMHARKDTDHLRPVQRKGALNLESGSNER